MKRWMFAGLIFAACAGFAGGDRIREAVAGYGYCMEKSCKCSAFQGSGSTCKCGHSFYKHN